MNLYELSELENEDYFCQKCGMQISTSEYLDSGLCEKCFEAECELADLVAEFTALNECEKCEEKWFTANCLLPWTLHSGCELWQSFLAQRGYV